MTKIPKDDLKKLYERIENTDALLVETDTSSMVYGSPVEVLALFSKMAHNILTNTCIDKEDLQKAFQIAVDAAEKGMDAVKEDKLDSLLSKVEKLANILKDLEKDEK